MKKKVILVVMAVLVALLALCAYGAIIDAPADSVGSLSFSGRVACVTESGHILQEYDASFEGYLSDPKGSEENRTYDFSFTGINIPNNCVLSGTTANTCTYLCGSERSVYVITGLIYDEWNDRIVSLTIRMDPQSQWYYFELSHGDETTRFVSIRDESLTPSDVIRLASASDTPANSVGTLSFSDRIACVTESGYILKEYDASFEAYLLDPKGSAEHRTYDLTFTGINIPNNCVLSGTTANTCTYLCGSERSVYVITGLIYDEWNDRIVSLTIRMDPQSQWYYFELSHGDEMTRFVSIRDNSLTPADVIRLANKDVANA